MPSGGKVTFCRKASFFGRLLPMAAEEKCKIRYKRKDFRRLSFLLLAKQLCRDLLKTRKLKILKNDFFVSMIPYIIKQVILVSLE